MASSGNFPLWSPAVEGATNLVKGNTRFTGATNSRSAVTSFAVPIGTKFYVECLVVQATNYNIVFGLVSPDQDIDTYIESQGTVNGMIFHGYSGSEWRTQALVNGSRQGFSGDVGMSTNRVLAMTVNRVDNEIKMYLDNTLIGNGTISISATQEYRIFASFTGGTASGVHMNINGGHDSTGAGDFSAASNADENGFGEFQYSPPSGFLAPCSANIPTSSDIDPAETDDNFPAKNFAPILYTGTGSNGNAITGLGFKPDLVFIQRRGATGAYNTPIIDSNRGVTKGHFMNRQDAEGNFTNDFSSFDSDGFTLQAGSTANINNASTTFVAWCWRANEGTTTSDSSGDITVTRQVNDAAKFSICTWTGNGSSGSTLPHGLGAVPRMTWIKKRDATSSTNVWHASFNNADPDSFGEPVGSNAWYANQGANGTFTTAPDATNLTLTAYGQVNGSSNTYVGYFWADVDGMQKFGGYKGNGNADGPFIYTGFRPAMVFIKRTDGAGSWQCHDSKRDTNNPVNQILLWNTTDAEFTSGTRLEFFSNGFKLVNSNAAINASGGDFVYGAWADVPFKYNNTF